jgi:hypothetical protein
VQNLPRPDAHRDAGIMIRKPIRPAGDQSMVDYVRELAALLVQAAGEVSTS